MRIGTFAIAAVALSLADPTHGQNVVTNLSYVSGNAQTTAAGARLTEPLVVRNDSGVALRVFWFLQFDSTGGARFSDGATLFRLVPADVGESVGETLTLGPNPGVVGVIACLTSSVAATPDGEVDCDPAPANSHVVFFGAGTPGADFGTLAGGGSASGDLQTGVPGGQLTNALSVTRTSGPSVSTAFVQISNDSTGGAHFVDGSTTLTRALPIGVPLNLPLLLGPNDGEVTVVLCGSDTAPDYVRCLKEDSPALFLFAESAVSSGPRVEVAGARQVGATLTLRAPGGFASYQWDVDGDGITDRVTSDSSLPVTYPGAFTGTVSVTATSGAKLDATTRKPLSLLAPRLTARVSGPMQEVCGNGDGIPQPGKRFRIPIEVVNSGNFQTVDGYTNFIAEDRYSAARTADGIVGKMLVDTPQIAVGTMQPGGRAQGTVTVTLAADAACGTTYGLRYTGGVDVLGSNPGPADPIANLAIPADANCHPFTGSCPALPSTKAAVVPREGLYYNANRSGNGLSNHIIPTSSGPVYFGLWFTGAQDRSPDWYAIQAPLTGNVAVSPIYHYQRVIGAPSFQVQRSTVGTAVVAMLGSERLLFAWQIGERSGTELMDYFVGGPVPQPNRTGAWYSPSEAGSGQVIHQYLVNGVPQYFAIQFIYDDAGTARWSLGQGTVSALAGGAPQLTFRVQCPGCPWLPDWNSFPIEAGSASLLIDDARNGHFSSSIVFPGPFNGSWNRSNLPIQILSNPQN